MSSSGDQPHVMEQIQQRRIEIMENDRNDNINITDARRQVTALESFFPRVSVKSIEEENGAVTAYIINVRNITIGPLDQISQEFARMKAQAYTKIKIPSKTISNIQLLSSREITLPFVGISTGRTFNTFRVEVE